MLKLLKSLVWDLVWLNIKLKIASDVLCQLPPWADRRSVGFRRWVPLRAAGRASLLRFRADRVQRELQILQTIEPLYRAVACISPYSGTRMHEEDFIWRFLFDILVGGLANLFRVRRENLRTLLTSSACLSKSVPKKRFVRISKTKNI